MVSLKLPSDVHISSVWATSLAASHQQASFPLRRFGSLYFLVYFWSTIHRPASVALILISVSPPTSGIKTRLSLGPINTTFPSASGTTRDESNRPVCLPQHLPFLVCLSSAQPSRRLLQDTKRPRLLPPLFFFFHVEAWAPLRVPFPSEGGVGWATLSRGFPVVDWFNWQFKYLAVATAWKWQLLSKMKLVIENAGTSS